VSEPADKLLQKLLIEDGRTLLVLNKPDGFELADGTAPADVVLLFARDRAQLERDADTALRSLQPGGVLWLAYPSPASGRQSDLSRRHGAGALAKAGLTDTTPISVDADWDALRFQPLAEVPGHAIPAADMLPVGRHATFVYRLVRLLAEPLFHLLFRFDIKGRENVPDQAAVIICNHLGWMDAISVLLVFPAEPRIHLLADPTSMMKNRALWTLVRATGGIVPVDRAQRDNTLLFRQVARCLELGGVVALFPEGDLGPREGVLLPFKKGFAHFAADARVPVVPVGLAGMKDLWVGKRLAMRIGAPIPTAGKTVDEVHALGEHAVQGLLPPYSEPSGAKPLRGWLTGLF
jgi:1-acyl-sn-glycerol-3-phosphate acyltransferase